MSNEMSDNQQKKIDEEYCSSCGAIIKKSESTSPKCGVSRSIFIKIFKDNPSIVSLVLGIVGLFFVGSIILIGIFGLIFGINGLKTDKKSIAIAGIVLNSLQFLLLIFGVIIVFWDYIKRYLIEIQ